jgi:ribosomal-protein-alanine N-acetyltransferase
MVHITKSTDAEDFAECARLMSESEPWTTLAFDYERCLSSFGGDFREVYLMKDGDKLAGFAIIQTMGVLRGYIQTVCFDPQYRNKGLGTALIRYCEERIFKISPNSFICYSSFNPAAGKLYERLGYELVGELKDLLVNGHSEFLLRKTIGSFADFNKGILKT